MISLGHEADSKVCWLVEHVHIPIIVCVKLEKYNPSEAYFIPSSHVIKAGSSQL